LIGYSENHDDYVHYRIDRMEAIKSEPTEHVYRQLDVQSYIEKHIMMYSGEAVMVRLKCASRFASDVQDQFGSSLVVRSSNDEFFECSVKVVISRLFFSWLLKYGDGIRILSPDSVIEEYKKVCLEVLGQYGE
ncbi:MAG: WYL domain-containing protein, partial [Erysipelotrichaceae bacterium]|nr:WYL domain-containing protein [Erysipelotrichaceae bacterium]